jgi:hypothetical protein
VPKTHRVRTVVAHAEDYVYVNRKLDDRYWNTDQGPEAWEIGITVLSTLIECTLVELSQ